MRSTISYPRKIKRVHMPSCCSGEGEQGGVEVMQGTAQRPECHQILLGKMMRDAVETEFFGDLTKCTHNLSTKKHFNKV